MKTLFKIVFISFAALILTQPASGQKLLKRLQDKVEQKIEQKVEQRADRKIDQAIDKQLDKVEESIEGKKERTEESGNKNETRESNLENRIGSILQGIGMSGEAVKVADNYAFNHLIEMHVESTNKNGKKKDEGEFIMHFSTDSKNLGYQLVSGDFGKSEMGMFIIDTENDATIMLSDDKGEKTGIVYGMGAFFKSIGENLQDEFEDSTAESYLENPNVKKTGRTKTIAGHKCDEYIYEDEETISETWITQELKLNTKDMFGSLFKTNLSSQGMSWGYPMESTSTDKKSGEKTMMQVTRVDSNSKVNFNMSEYQLTNLGSFIKQ